MKKELIAPVLEDLLSDCRLARLFSKDARHCAFQLWILQINNGQSTENRFIYGRLIPYNYSRNSWSSSEDDHFNPFGQVEAQVIRLNLYLESIYCADLLRLISAGHSISEISSELNLGSSDRFKTRFGATALFADQLVYRPVAYLLNRDAHDRRSSSSPHGGASVLSASITQTDKEALFRLVEGYDVALTKMIVETLNAETGMDFGGIDATRFRDLELMVFPALDDVERSLLSQSWTDTPFAFVARFNPMQVANFGAFQFRLEIRNDDQITYSGIANAERDAEGWIQCKFELNDQLRGKIDTTELEIFGFDDEYSRQGTLCCQWRMGCIREVLLQSHLAGRSATRIKFDWLEKTTRPAASKREMAALTISRDNLGTTNRIGGRTADPWVPANCDLKSLFTRLYPPKSEGRFFLRWGPGNGEGRLLFVEWFKALLVKYCQQQMVIFDPYFESAGLGLILLGAVPQADYIVFRSLPKSSKADETTNAVPNNTALSGINNLLANCEQNRQLLKGVKLRIFGLKEGRLHDRYILIMAHDGLPIAGFHLSNSFQSAAEDHPLLVTPIPADVLLQVEQYKSILVKEADETKAAQHEGEVENPSMRLLFDSAASAMAPQHYEPLRFLENAKAGDVLSKWTGQLLLEGLSGAPLKEQMATLNLLKDGALVLPGMAGLSNCLSLQTDNFAGFTPHWEVIGELLAHSHAGDDRHRELEFKHSFLRFLAQFLLQSFARASDEANKELAVIDARLFRDPIEKLLHCSLHTYHLLHATKYVALSWPEFFAIKFLWWHASDTLLEIAEAQISFVPKEPQGQDVARLSLLSQIVSEISLSVQFDISDLQRERLMRSGNGLLQWLGLNAIERRLEAADGLAVVLQLIAGFPHDEQVRALGWMVQRAARNPQTDEIYRGLVAALHQALPATIPKDELRRLVDSMRGHMRQLAWAEPWLFQDVIFPLLQKEQATFDDACEIWVQELTAMLEPDTKHQRPLFDRAREGLTTNIAAYLFAHSCPARQRASINAVEKILRRQQQIQQQPLASTSDWTRWNDALLVAMWIMTFTRWAQYYLRGSDEPHTELDKLSQNAGDLAMVRPMNEWRSMDLGKQGGLAAFLDQVNELLAL